MKNTPTEKCAEIMEHYGVENQLDQLQEECGELIAAVNHSRRQLKLSREFWEELADVQIMIRQFEVILPDDQAEEFMEIINSKLDRQLERIKNERTDEP